MATEIEQLKNQMDEMQKQLDLRILDHTHDGLNTRQIDNQDLFGVGKNVNPVYYVHLKVTDPTTDVATGDDQAHIHIGAEWDRWYLVEVHAEVITAGTTNTTDIQIANDTDGVNMLSTVLTIDTTETGSDTAATAAVIDVPNNRDVLAENDLLRIDIDAVSDTAPKGLIVTLGFQEFREA